MDLVLHKRIVVAMVMNGLQYDIVGFGELFSETLPTGLLLTGKFLQGRLLFDGLDDLFINPVVAKCDRSRVGHWSRSLNPG